MLYTDYLGLEQNLEATKLAENDALQSEHWERVKQSFKVKMPKELEGRKQSPTKGNQSHRSAQNRGE